ncbi:TPA: hypothetical protein OUD55_004268, partial [Citrobacter koseri]|nr:hypothetical protein [Citrobacter koseri]
DWVATLMYIIFIIIMFGTAVDLDKDPQTFNQGMSIFLSGMGGLIFSFLLKSLSVQWKNNFHNVKDSEYKELFKEYANSKRAESISSNAKE